VHIGILGTGGMAAALAQAWTRAGHDILVGGRSLERARTLAGPLGDRVQAAAPADVAAGSDVVIVAVAWEGLDEVIALAGGSEGAFAGKPIIECTNAVDYATGLLKPERGSAAEHVAALAPGGHVVKALHLYAGTSWLTAPGPGAPVRTVAICGDDARALAVASGLIRDLGGEPAVVGGLAHARQLEGVAGFVMALVAGGHDPVTAVPSVPAAA